VWKRSGKVLIEKKKGESGPKLRLGAGLVPIRDQAEKELSTGQHLNGSVAGCSRRGSEMGANWRAAARLH
jgi:hypothetical protein